MQQNQEQILIGGNPHLKPEKARGWGGGIVVTPHFVPGFSAAIDYYHTELSNTILIGGVAGYHHPRPRSAGLLRRGADHAASAR